MKHKKIGSLGEILLQEKWVDENGMREAMEYKDEKNIKLAEALIQLKLIDESLLIKVLSKQLDIPIKRKNEITVDKKAIGIVPIEIAKEHGSFPFYIDSEKETISFLTKDPLNLLLEDRVFHETGYRAVFYLGLTREIESLIYEHYESEKLNKELEGITNADKDDDLFDMDTKVDNSAIVSIVNNIFRNATQEKASDIHIALTESYVEVRYRIDGILHKVQELPKRAHASLISRIKTMANMDIAEKRKPQDGRIQITIADKNIDMRINTMPTVHGEKITARILDKESVLLNIKDIGFQDKVYQEFEDLIHRPVGIVLLTGPTGSGKTSTLYTAINELNDVSRNIVTIEDPVEYKLNGIVQSQVNEKAGYGFANGLRAILRQDPDIVLIGEIRDTETAKIAVNAANTGHLVLATLHSNDSVSTITRLLDMGIEAYLLASTVGGIVNQRLIRRICTECKVSYESKGDSPERTFFGIGADEHITLHKGEGCENCKYTGYKGRVAIQELFVIKKEIKKMIANGLSEGEILDAAVKNGMITMKQDGLEKAKQGVTTLSEVKRFLVES